MVSRIPDPQLQQILREAVEQGESTRQIAQRTGYSYSTIRRRIRRNQPNSPPVRPRGRQSYFENISDAYFYLQSQGIPLNFECKKFAGILQAELIKKFPEKTTISQKYCYSLIRKLKKFRNQLQLDVSMSKSPEQNLELQPSQPYYEEFYSTSNHNNPQPPNNQLSQPQIQITNNNDEQYEMFNFNNNQSYQQDISSYDYLAHTSEENIYECSLSLQNDASQNINNNFTQESQQYESGQDYFYRENQIEDNLQDYDHLFNINYADNNNYST
ncbi:hypothetical protein ABPG74_001032 [Tetrahymena malaccensis]